VSKIKTRPQAHPVHTVNRVEMARRIVGFLDTDPIFEGANTSEVVIHFSEVAWALVASTMGERTAPSESTVAMVVGILVGREGVA